MSAKATSLGGSAGFLGWRRKWIGGAAVSEEVTTNARGGRSDSASDLLERGRGFEQQGQLRRAIADYRKVIDLAGDDPTPEASVLVAIAGIGVGDALVRLGELAEGIAAYDQVIDRCGDDPALEVHTGNAMVGKGEALAALGEMEEAKAVFGTVIDRYERSSIMQRQTVRALFGKGDALAILGETEAALAIYGQIVGRYYGPKMKSAELRRQTAEALIRQGLAQATIGLIDEAIESYEFALRVNPDDVRAKAHLAQWRFAHGEDKAGSDLAVGALAVAGDDPDLVLVRTEASFYLFAHDPLRRQTAGADLKRLLSGGLSTGDWSFQPNIDRMKADTDPRTELVEAVAAALAKGDATGLDAYEEWRALDDPSSFGGVETKSDVNVLARGSAPTGTLARAGAWSDLVVPGEPVAKSDMLDIDDEVEVLVSVLIASKTPMPLAVGLFGDWGSGKSFFMAMMEERIQEIVQEGMDEENRSDPAWPFCRNVRQVRFNAWHFTEQDLWASLATTLFDQLARPSEEEQDRKARKDLNEHKAKVESAEGKTKDAEEKLERADEEARSPLQLTVAAMVSAIASVRNDKDLVGELKQLAADDEDASRPGTEKDGESGTTHSGRADQPGEEGGEPGTTADGKALVDAFTTAEQIGREATAVRQLYRQQLLGPRLRILRRASLLMAAIALIALLTGLWLQQWGPAAPLVAFLLAVLPPVSVALRSTLLLLQGIHKVFDKRQRDLLAASQALKSAQKEEKSAREKFDKLRQRLEEPGHQLREFVRERAASPVYRQQLGTVSQLRSDFEELERLLDLAKEKSAGSDGVGTDGDKEDGDNTDGDLKIARKVAETTGHPDRIVLYIDDLDRCPQEKVIDILQAIHLLLAFRLFAVVVGVDSRWLTKSLQSHYASLLDEPADYLEKIFQIPFALEPFSGRPDPSKSRLLRMLAEHADGPTAPAKPTRGSARTQPERPEMQVSEQGTRAAGPQMTGTATSGPAEADVGTRGGVSPGRAPSSQASRSAAGSGEAGGEPLPRRAARRDAVRLDEWELAYVTQLGGLLATPRAAKRFVNTYRMLRVSTSNEELEKFKPPDHGYKAPAFLTAVMVGLSRISPSLFQDMLRRPPDEEAAICLKSVPEIAAALKQNPKLLPEAATIHDFTKWIPKVSRFSFRLHSLAAAPTVSTGLVDARFPALECRAGPT